MKNLNALAISISSLGALATFLALGPLNGVYLIWAAFLAWGAYFALGADDGAFKGVITGGTFGAFLAWIVAIVILSAPVSETIGLPAWAAIAVGVGVLIAVLAANAPAFAKIPATVFGFASSFAYLLQTPDVLRLDVLLSASLRNSFILISLSVVIGSLFGLLSARISAAMTES